LKHLIIGNSAAGVAAAEEIRRLSPEAQITILDREGLPFYSRVLTTWFLGGKLEREGLFLRDREFYSRLECKLEKAEAKAILPHRRQVVTKSGDTFSYDYLLLATGAAATPVEVKGASLPGVFTLRNLADAEGILPFIEAGERAVILGGGLVSLKSAEALRHRGMAVTLAVSSSRILSRVLDETGANLVHKHLETRGYEIVTGEDCVEIKGEGRVSGVLLSSGREIPCRLVLAGKGVTPEVDLARQGGLQVKRGIAVNQRLETSAPGIFAAGDVAETRDRLTGQDTVSALWGNAVEQGRLAGRGMAGYPALYRGSLARNSLVLEDLGIISAGQLNGTAAGKVLERFWGNSYRKLVLQGQALMGVLAVGEPQGAGIIQGYLGRRLPVKIGEAFLNGSLSRAGLYREHSPFPRA